jgi:hypothetical protein
MPKPFGGVLRGMAAEGRSVFPSPPGALLSFLKTFAKRSASDPNEMSSASAESKGEGVE